LNDRTIAAHVVLLIRTNDILQRRGVGVAHNPQSNMKLASGVAPVPQISANLRLGLETDGAEQRFEFVGRDGHGGKPYEGYFRR